MKNYEKKVVKGHTMVTFSSGKNVMTKEPESQTFWLKTNGKDNGSVRFVEHVGRYIRNGQEYRSLEILIDAIDKET